MSRIVSGRTEPRLAREMGLAGLTATGVCSMVGAGINVIPFMIQRNVPGSITVVPNIHVRTVVAAIGVIMLAGCLSVHTWKDLTGPAEAWYFRSTPVWAVVMAVGSLVYRLEVRALRRAGVDLHARFAALPPE